jgi:alpha-mannosidase
MQISQIESTDLFLEPAAAPRQVVRVTVSGPASGVRVRIEGPTVRTPEPAVTPALAAGEERVVEVGVLVAAPASEGSVHRVTAIAETPGGRVTADGEIRAAATGWTMWMISHFHYDPVWWNTQRGFTELWQQLPDVPGADRLRPPFVRTAFDLVRAHLDAARQDDDYRFVLAEIDYLKPYWDVFVDDRADLRRMLHEGRVELVGGMYNEPNTNLTHPESTIRNAVYGVGYQRDVLGGDPQSAWMLDVFGHDPAFPGLMADAGLTSSSWARGPYHHVGAKRHTGDITRMQFPSEFEWVSPTGRGVLTAYMANHYVAGWDVERKDTLDEAMAEAYAQYRELRKVAATRNVMLPVGHDHNIPSRWCTEIHREWAKRYVWPRFTMGLPRDFFAAVRAELGTRGASPQTRDMNPVYTGKDVSYIDTKQAQRAIETTVLDAERLGTLAALLGTRYPAEALDKAWRLLAYGAHHDAVTGTESDQVYLDLLAGWREAHDLAGDARREAVEALAVRADTGGDGRALLAVNPLSWARGGIARVHLSYPAPGPHGVAVRDDEGELPAVVDGIARHADGSIASVSLSVAARDIPALGYAVWHVVSAPVFAGWAAQAGQTTIRNEVFEVTASPGGALNRIVDRRTGRELLRADGLGGEITVQDEYAAHPKWQEGPWHLLPKGPGRGLSETPASVRAEHSAAGSRLVSVATMGELRITREVVLWAGAERIDFRTHVDGSIGQDRLLRVRFDLDLPGTLPVSEVGFAAIGRGFGFPEADAAEHLWTLDNPAHTWAGLSSTARISLDGGARRHAIGVAEVIAEDDARELLVALAGQGVTATRTSPGGPRYGSLDADSNLPDVRIVVGADNPVAEAVLASAGDEYRAVLAATGRVFVPGERAVLVPDADLRGVRDLPVLIAADPDALVADLADATIEVRQPASLAGVGDPLTGYSVALVNHGTPGFVSRQDGTLYLSLMRACTGWPSGIWIDGPRRGTPDGAGFALQHWSHTFRYSLVAGPGDWREAGFVRAGQELNHPIRADEVVAGAGPLPRRAGLGSVSPDNVVLTALKPRGNPLAAGLPGDADLAEGVAVRLYEAHGSATEARIRLHGGLHDAVVTNVLEEEGAGSVRTDGGEVVVDLSAADVVTVAARPLGAAAQTRGVAGTEEVQPVFTRYWLHNKGPAPVGNLPVSVYVHPTAAVLPAQVRVTVGSATSAAAGVVDLDVPAGLAVTPAGPYRYDLRPGEYRHFDLRVTAGEAAGGQYFLAARIRDRLGQILEDVVALTVAPADPADPAGLDAVLGPAEVTVVPGATAALTLRLRNLAASPVRGEAELLSPFGTWGTPDDDLSVGPRTRGFSLPAGGTGTLDFTVAAPAGARPGGRWWALARVTSFGRVIYTAAVSLAAG